jgi:hypothetical protein
MKFSQDLTLKEFVKHFNEYVEDIMDTNGNVNSHTFPARIYVEVEGSDFEYSIKELEVGYMGGCGCPQSITLIIKKDL